MLDLQESLNRINTLREKAKAELEEGKTPDISVQSIDLMERMTRNMYGDYSKGRTSIKEAITSTDTMQLIPKIIEGKLRENEEPALLGTKFFTEINVDSKSAGAVYVIPIAGEAIAGEVGEGGRYPESNFDMSTIENSALEIRVKKIGCKVTITEEAIEDSQWDVLGMNIKKLSRAMARYKEEWIFRTFTRNGHLVFDNALRKQNPEAGTSGRDIQGNFNDTLAVEDFLDMTLTLMGNGVNPTDAIMHPLTWVVFARNAMLSSGGLSFGALGGNNVSPWGTIQGTPGPFGLQNNGNGQKLIMKPEQVQNRLPVPMQVNFSPFVRFNKENRRFDMYVVDRNEVGVIVMKDRLTTEQWKQPEKDILSLKCKEKYGISVIHNGRGIAVAKDIAVAPSYPIPPTVKVQNN